MTKLIARRPNGKLEWIEEPEGMDKWQFQKWKRQVTKDGTILLNYLDDEFKKYKQIINKQMTQSKVKAVQANGTYDSNFGLLYKYEYTMEDGTTLTANHKKEGGNFRVGEDVEYEVTGSNDYGSWGKVKKPDTSGYSGGGFQPNPDRDKGIRVGHAINNAVNLVCARGLQEGIPIMEGIKELAKEIYRVSEELNNEL